MSSSRSAAGRTTKKNWLRNVLSVRAEWIAASAYVRSMKRNSPRWLVSVELV